MWRLDHLAVTAGDLASGVAMVEAAFGVTMAPGGAHAAMGTHNRLLGMGDIYLEVIAVDPDAPTPPWPRWFDLDRKAGPPRLANWVVACDDLAAALADGPPGAGKPMALSRGDLAWRMAVPEGGQWPMDGAFPALIEWQGPLHPAQRLPDSGLRLSRLEVGHPQADRLQALLSPLQDARVAVVTGPAGFRAIFDTPFGPRSLG